jgi:hypothetical protein
LNRKNARRRNSRKKAQKAQKLNSRKGTQRTQKRRKIKQNEGFRRLLTKKASPAAAENLEALTYR